VRSLAVEGPAVGRPAVGCPAVGCPAVGSPAVGGPAVGCPAVGSPAVGSPAVGSPAVGGQAVGVLGIEIMIQSVAVSQETGGGFKMDVSNLLSKEGKMAVAVDRGPAMVLRGLRIKMSCQRAEPVVMAKTEGKARSLRAREVAAKGKRIRSNLKQRVFWTYAGLLSLEPFSHLTKNQELLPS